MAQLNRHPDRSPRFATRPHRMEERRDWFAQFADAGPYRMLVARPGNQIHGYA
ncbi:hypothetical protein AB0F36_35505 [Streptomyces sp. NPDC029080]|uniref:hypothetical protein n=1 Tax=Streptomyces sp. NPDC029080 TaxID=3155017 RepID=UPI0033FC76FC